ncbi:esterase-like activity of phytase family protein [Christiangramia sabulilitoris]|uniref:Esterase-like activity of phytase family protein n=1 Tax=Christiangramia sabulilitoris TaxID=2583991 RepID=A0A550I2Z7_9FLAO|nr:esterase-like activity of phytase family protein [Christiangramia sabulilitoris]TRO65311.1 esterase-like activity of phytase family protein [Christiangramia sabulilitoris]
MRKIITLVIIPFLLSSCAVTRKVDNDTVEIQFLDEYVLPSNTKLESTLVGGLSGIDYRNGKYFLVSDQASNPRIYMASIGISNNAIDTISIDQLITIKKTPKFSEDYFDLESVRFDPLRDEFLVSSEGKIDAGRDPGIYTVSNLGEVKSAFRIPGYFQAKGVQKPRDNGVFEGLSESFDNRGYWVATELPLEKDGPKPKLFPSRAHIRITKYDKNTGDAMKQFVYKLDGISKFPINYFAVNGLTEILEFAPDRFLVLERSYSAGYGSHGNTVKIFEADASKASNTLQLEKLAGEKYKIAEKKLLFNFNSVKKELTKNIIDNLEGLCLGPLLENGKQSLILVSDNNFNSYAEQINQFILMQIEFKQQ